jgi:hypothetical protein
MPFFYTGLRKMHTELITALEAFWAAKTFNRFSDLTIDIPFTDSDIKLLAQVNAIDFDRLKESVLYENITVKEYTISSVEKCFALENNNSGILAKKKSIEEALLSYRNLLDLSKTA